MDNKEEDSKEEDTEREYSAEREGGWGIYAQHGCWPVGWVHWGPDIGALPPGEKEGGILVNLRIQCCKLFKTGYGNNADGCTCGWHQSGHRKDRFPIAVGASPLSQQEIQKGQAWMASTMSMLEQLSKENEKLKMEKIEAENSAKEAKAKANLNDAQDRSGNAKDAPKKRRYRL